MEEKIIKISNNVFLHLLNGENFKTSFVAGFFLSDLKREDVTINALIPAVLTRGTANLPTMKEISLKLESLYGATLDGSSDKIGDKQALQFYVTTINDEYALENEELLNESIKTLLDVIYNPKLVDGKFDETYVAQEKENLKELIKARINDKGQYAITRLVEEMFKDEPYGIYKYGNLEDVDKINAENLYEQYKKVLGTSEVHFYVSSSQNVDEHLFDICKKSDLEIAQTPSVQTLNIKIESQTIIEKQDITQGKLVLGYNVNINKEDLYKMQVYNAILGGSSNSKMFQNVREKASLAYTARSTFYKHKNALIIFAGIEVGKYEKALAIIKEQVNDMKNGNFSDEDIKDAKVFLENLMRSFYDSQDILIDLNMGQYIFGSTDTIEEMINNINKVTREDILKVANSVTLNTVYYLTANDEKEA